MRYRLCVGLVAPPLTHMWASFVASQNTNEQPALDTPCGHWNENWDGRDPVALGMRKKSRDKFWEQEELDQRIDARRPKAVRNIILIRHGQYEDLEKMEEKKLLTEKGRRQASATGRRLQELRSSGAMPFATLTSSTMLRAMHTADLIYMELETDPLQPVIRKADEFLCEGVPCKPDPDVDFYHEMRVLEEGTRVEAAFRRYFYRASPKQAKDSYEVLACHAHVIRYFICRALQFPPQAWVRFSIPHASITWIRILPNGRVVLQWFGNVGHMPPELVSWGLEDR